MRQNLTHSFIPTAKKSIFPPSAMICVHMCNNVVELHQNICPVIPTGNGLPRTQRFPSLLTEWPDCEQQDRILKSKNRRMLNGAIPKLPGAIQTITPVATYLCGNGLGGEIAFSHTNNDFERILTANLENYYSSDQTPAFSQPTDCEISAVSLSFRLRDFDDYPSMFEEERYRKALQEHLANNKDANEAEFARDWLASNRAVFIKKSKFISYYDYFGPILDVQRVSIPTESTGEINFFKVIIPLLHDCEMPRCYIPLYISEQLAEGDEPQVEQSIEAHIWLTCRLSTETTSLS